ncbi:HdeD family acid-resistance protein [Brevibacterium sp.]|uniref:HdeD family acid-resistance protein n=1 Tax=Brevibacterium sp. TaxID=1701 RepID=UPI0025BE1260|nr:HdeD family acid-resistance protein [Brevibacterium sp.]
MMSAPSDQQAQTPGFDWDRLRSGARTALIVQGVLSLLMGLAFLFMPFASVWAFGIVFGAWTLVTGAATIVSWFTRDKEHRSGWALFSGIVSVLAGIAVMVMPQAAAIAVVYIMAFWAILLGILYAVNSFELRKLGARFWWGVLLSGILAVVLGFIMLFNTGAAVLGLIWLIGIYAIVDGIAEIVIGVRMRRR